MVRCHVWEPHKDGLPYLEILKGWLKDSILLGNTKWRTNCYRLCLSIKNSHFKEFWILILQYNNSLRAPWKRYSKIKAKSKRGIVNRTERFIIEINWEFDYSLHHYTATTTYIHCLQAAITTTEKINTTTGWIYRTHNLKHKILLQKGILLWYIFPIIKTQK